MNPAKIIDQTFLKIGASEEEIKRIAKEALKYDFRSLCILPEHTKSANEILEGSDVKLTTLIDEPTGTSSHHDRVEMAEKAKEDGSDELELVMKIDPFKNEKYDEVLEDLQVISTILPTKVIIGSGYLTDKEIEKASELVKKSGAISVKTATVNDPLDHSELEEKAKHIKIMKNTAPELLIKASGSVRTLDDLKKMVEVGADIIGTSSGVQIVNEFKGEKKEEKKDGRVIE